MTRCGCPSALCLHTGHNLALPLTWWLLGSLRGLETQKQEMPSLEFQERVLPLQGRAPWGQMASVRQLWHFPTHCHRSDSSVLIQRQLRLLSVSVSLRELVYSWTTTTGGQRVRQRHLLKEQFLGTALVPPCRRCHFPMMYSDLGSCSTQHPLYPWTLQSSTSANSVAHQPTSFSCQVGEGMMLRTRVSQSVVDVDREVSCQQYSRTIIYTTCTLF